MQGCGGRHRRSSSSPIATARAHGPVAKDASVSELIAGQKHKSDEPAGPPRGGQRAVWSAFASLRSALLGTRYVEFNITGSGSMLSARLC